MDSGHPVYVNLDRVQTIAVRNEAGRIGSRLWYGGEDETFVRESPEQLAGALAFNGLIDVSPSAGCRHSNGITSCTRLTGHDGAHEYDWDNA